MIRGISPSRILLWTYAAVVVLACFGTPVFGGYDEAIPLVQARLVAQGLRPSVDFFSFYPPLVFYLNAAFFLIFGQTILAQRFVQAAFYIAVLVAADRLLRSKFVARRHIAAYSVLLLAVAIGPKLLLPSWVGAAISVLALFAYLFDPASTRYVAGAGLLTALALGCRVNFGAYVAFVIAADLAVDWLNTRRLNWRLAAAFLGALAASFTALCLLWYGRNIGAAIEQCLITPARQHAGLRFLDLPPTAGVALAVVFPSAWFCVRLVLGKEQFPRRAIIPLVLGLAWVLLARVLYSDPHVAYLVVLCEIASVLFLHLFVYRLERFEFCVVLFFACYVHYFLSRAADSHWEILVCVASLLFPYLVVTRGTAALLCAAAASLILTLPDFKPTTTHLRHGAKLLFAGGIPGRVSDFSHLSETPGAWTAIYPDEDELEAVRYIHVRTSPSDAVFVGVNSHYAASWNDVRAYWLLERPVGVSYAIFEPSVTPRPEIQRVMAADILRTNTRWALIVYEPSSDPAFSKGHYPQSHLLDEFLKARFSEVARFGKYAILLRNVERP